MTTMVTEFDPDTGNKLSETVETTDGLTASKTAYKFSNLGMLMSVSSSFTDEEGKTSDFSLNSSYDVEGNIVQQTEETSDFDNNSKVSKYIFGKLSKPLSLDVTESGEDGTPTARSFSTFLYHSDGSFAETVTEINTDGTIANSYIINHDAPVEEEADVVEEDAEEADEDADVTDEGGREEMPTSPTKTKKLLRKMPNSPTRTMRFSARMPMPPTKTVRPKTSTPPRFSPELL